MRKLKRTGQFLISAAIRPVLLCLILSGCYSPDGAEEGTVATRPLPEATASAEDMAFPPTRAEVRAVSLAELQKRLSACMPSRNCPRELLELGGIKLLRGIVIDSEAKDLILYGETDPRLPPIFVEDFVVALRNSRLKYAPLRGNTYIYSFPGCSIDPNPSVLQRLQIIGDQIGARAEEIERNLEEWKRVCAEPQKVRVEGIPFNTRFGGVMVEADYLMKDIVNGSEEVEIPGFVSMLNMAADRASSGASSASLSTMNRFWFFPGETEFVEGDGIIQIRRCRVSLLTEEEFLAGSGQVIGSGRSSPLAATFSAQFSAFYEELADQRPIYADLQNLFRFFALAQAIRSKSGQTRILDLTYFLEEFPVESVPVVKELPGKSALLKGGNQFFRFWLPACGGVSMALPLDDLSFQRFDDESLSDLRQRVLHGRQSSSLSWPVRSTNLLSSRKNRRGNIQNKTALCYTLKDEGSHYTLVGEDGPLYEGLDTKGILESIQVDLAVRAPLTKGSAAVRTIRLQLDDFSVTKADNLRDSLEIREAGRGDLELLTRETDLSRDVYFSLGTKVRRIQDPVQTNKGGFRAAFEFLKGSLRVIVEVYSTSKRALTDFLAKIELGASPMLTPVDLVNRTRSEIMKQHGLSQEEFETLVKKELDDTEIGELLTDRPRSPFQPSSTVGSQLHRSTWHGHRRQRVLKGFRESFDFQTAQCSPMAIRAVK